MNGVSRKAVSHLNAHVNLTLSIPEVVANTLLKGSEYEGELLGLEPDHDREAIGERLDEAVAERFHEFLDYMQGDAEVQCDW